MRKKDLNDYFSENTRELIWPTGEVDPVEAIIVAASAHDATVVVSDSKAARGYINYLALSIETRDMFEQFCKIWKINPSSEYATYFANRFITLDSDDHHDLYQNLAVLWERLFLDLLHVGKLPSHSYTRSDCCTAATEVVNVILYRSLEE